MQTVDHCPRAFIVILEYLDKLLGLQIDEIVGEQEIFIKSLDDNLGKFRNVSGATVVGGGQVIIILEYDWPWARQGKPIERLNDLGKKPLSDKGSAQTGDRADCWDTGKACGQRTINHRLDCEMQDNGRFVDGVNPFEIDKQSNVAGNAETLGIDFGVDEQASKAGQALAVAVLGGNSNDLIAPLQERLDNGAAEVEQVPG